MSETRPHRPEAWAWSYWPAVVGIAAPFLAWGAVAFWPMLFVAAGLLLVAVPMWVRESTTAEERPQRVSGTHIVLGAALALASALFYAAAIRAFAAHDLLRSDTWPAAAADMIGAWSIAATVAMLGAAVTAYATWRTRSLIVAALTAMLALGHLGAIAIHVVDLRHAGFVASEGPAGSLFYWITGVHGVFTIASVVALLVTAWYAARRGVAGPLAAAALFFAWIVAAWLIVYGVVYAKLLAVEGSRIL